jgi:cytochrome d ubiquinol oxidase subunit I
MFGLDNVDLSRLQFAWTAGVHFLFVPLTLGLSFIMAIMETIYVKTGKQIYKDMVKFWGVLFGINFAMGVATGIPMEFQFGTNWSYYAHYVGDIFGAPLAIEGLMAFFLEATFIGLFFFGWDKLTPKQHLATTWLLFLGANFSGLWILIANGWMQNPIGSYFNFDTMRMEMDNFSSVVFNHVAQFKFLHTLTSAYILGSAFVIAVSSYYILKNRNLEFAKRSILIASIVGLCSTMITAYAGHTQGQLINKVQKAKMVAMEGVWESSDSAPFSVVAIIDQKNQRNTFDIEIPHFLSFINGGPVVGGRDLIKINEQRIRNGLVAYKALVDLKQNRNDKNAKEVLSANVKDLGYALLLNRLRPDILNATDAEIHQSAINTIPKVMPVYYSFRIMVGLGVVFFFYFMFVYVSSISGNFLQNKFLQKSAFLVLPLTYLAIQLGWFVAEYGRQPWVIQDVLPTFKGASHLASTSVALSLMGFVVIYVVLGIVDVYLMLKQIKKGPDSQIS